MITEITEKIEPSPNEGIIPITKKITKLKKLNPSPLSKKERESADKDPNSKKYETFNNAQKTNILVGLRDGLMKICKVELEEKDNYVEDLLELLPAVELKEYNKLLGRVLAEHIEGFVSSPKILTQWRKKIKGWIHNTGKPENRGNPLVPFEKLENFRNEVVRILKNMPFRCFPLLRQNILKVLERFHKEDEIFNGPQPFNTNVCSKHWWFNFMQRNQDIKDMWEAIPLEREGKKLKIHAQQQQEQREKEKMKEEEKPDKEETKSKASTLHMTDPIFSAQYPNPATTLQFPTLPKFFGPSGYLEVSQGIGPRVPDPYYIGMKALEYLFASRAQLKQSLVEMNQTSKVQGQETEGEISKMKEEIEVKVGPLDKKEEEMSITTKVSPENPSIKSEETKIKIEVEPMDSKVEAAQI